ncbi:glycosyltransferase family 1 protein [Desulfovibrio psychrotolerans]|uniref:Glycosyl transferase n=1 Tax=Desulfovibrio psychrotolerans TaxID=415242 RepID=A0A7J0BS52_9BACT|nr:glycosyltransferase family 1 protein [Desulfovibrio psychrotolerans]GFM36546.1 hypothetical protein DSM19430T_12300 [Desulfovibrio psychrotolerans]
MRTYIFLPPLKGMTGGVAVLHQVAEHLHAGGFAVSVVPREPGTPLPAGVPVCPWNELTLSQHDLWLVPEGWVNALTPGLQAGARCVVYVQNWSYLLSSLPPGVQWTQLPVFFLNVSQPVAWFTEQATGRSGPILRPGIDTRLFCPAPSGQNTEISSSHDAASAPGSTSGTTSGSTSGSTFGPITTPTIGWMPRKNKALAVRIRETFEARRALQGKPPARWLEIHGMTRQGVADSLRSAHIFLSTGFPEGCPLPPLEALASGCILAGFSGMGGWDYMRQALPPHEGGYVPWWPLREVPWQGNALVAADADVPAAVNGLETAARWLETDAPQLAALRANAARTVSHYTLESQRQAVLELWRQAAEGSLFMR